MPYRFDDGLNCPNNQEIHSVLREVAGIEEHSPHGGGLMGQTVEGELAGLYSEPMFDPGLIFLTKTAMLTQ